MSNQLTTASLALLERLVKEAEYESQHGDMLEALSKFTAKERGNLSDLKKKGYVETVEDDSEHHWVIFLEPAREIYNSVKNENGVSKMTDLNKMSFEELNAHQQEIAKAMEAKKEEAIEALKAKIATALVEFEKEGEALGVDVLEFIGVKSAKKERKPRKKVEPKYRLPSGEEWGGAGRMKKEFAIWLEENPDKTLEDLLIKKD